MRIPEWERWARLRQTAEMGRDGIRADLRIVEVLFARLLFAFARLHEGGARIGAGSDVPSAPGMMPGWGLHQELEWLVRMGMTPAKALRAATWLAAGILDVAALEHLRPGACADLMVVRGDPTIEITETRMVEAAWLGGQALDFEAGWSSVAEDGHYRMNIGRGNRMHGRDDASRIRDGASMNEGGLASCAFGIHGPPMSERGVPGGPSLPDRSGIHRARRARRGSGGGVPCEGRPP